jgi:hypothetical protein
MKLDGKVERGGVGEFCQNEIGEEIKELCENESKDIERLALQLLRQLDL